MPFLFDLVRHPIVQAPMAGGPGGAPLAVAVSDAGGLGFLAAGYKTPSDLEAEIASVRARTNRPFGVNLFVPQPPTVDDAVLRAYVTTLGPDAGEPVWDDDGWDDKLAVVAAARVAVVSFTFGCPDASVIASLQRAGTRVLVTVTTVAEARAAIAAGADGVCAQGFEAGAHRGSFDDNRGEENDIGLLALLGDLRADVDVPVIAAGGLMDGRDIAAVLVAGAHAAQLGTAFLRCPEAGTNATHAAALVSPPSDATAITRAFTGRRARGIVNRFMRDHAGAPSAYPQIHHATRAMRRAAAEHGDPANVHLWAGQGFRRGRGLPAGDLVAVLMDECRAALAGVPGL